MPGLYIGTWHGFWAPKGTPEAIVAKLNGAALAAMADPAVADDPISGMDLPLAIGGACCSCRPFTRPKLEIASIVKAAGIKAEWPRGSDPRWAEWLNQLERPGYEGHY